MKFNKMDFSKKVLTVRPLSCIIRSAARVSGRKTLEKNFKKGLDNLSGLR